MSETRVREMTPEDLRKMQMVELELLLELDRICRKHNIKYMLCSGTLLGAVRHKGFIPWDDDVDVRMLRSEYEKFVLACKTELDHDRIFLQDFESDPEYRWGYAKLINLKTVYERVGQDNLKMKKCMFIDIFISDGIPNSEIGYQIQRAVCFCIRKVLWAPVGKKVSKSPLLRAWYAILSLIPRNASVALIYKMAKMFPEDKCNSFRSLTFPITGRLKKEWLMNLKEIEFEGHMLYVPEEAEAWLELGFGSDYMELPPESERKGHNTAAYYRFEDEMEV